MALYPLVRPLAFALDAERAHRLTIAALKLLPAGRPRGAGSGAGGRGRRARFPQSGRAGRRLRQGCRGLPADARLRLRLRRGRDADAAAAGRQSEAAAVPAGRGPGGDQPDGLQQSAARRRRWRGSTGATGRAGIVGVNIGANKDSADRIADYAAGVRAMLGVADYLTVNISSPNTPGLRALQDKGALDELLAAVTEARGAGPPLFLKVAPDLERGGDRRHRPGRDRPPDRRADRRQHHALAARSSPRSIAARRAGFPARR